MNKLGYGFGLDVFKAALVVELEFLGLKCELEKKIRLFIEQKKLERLNWIF